MSNILKVEMTDFADAGHEERWGWILNESQALGLSKKMVVPFTEIGKNRFGVGGNQTLHVISSRCLLDI